MTKRLKATARVKVTLEVPADGVWGDDCTVSQVRNQSERETLALLNTVLTRAGIKILGAPTVQAVVVVEVDDR